MNNEPITDNRDKPQKPIIRGILTFNVKLANSGYCLKVLIYRCLADTDTICSYNNYCYGYNDGKPIALEKEKRILIVDEPMTAAVTMIVRADYYYFFLLHMSHLNVVRHNNYVTVAYFVQTGESRQTVLTSALNHVTMSVTKKRTSKYDEYF